MSRANILSNAATSGRLVLVFALGTMVLFSSLPVTEMLALEFEPIEFVDMEEESEQSKEKEEKEESEKYHQGIFENVTDHSTHSIQLYFKGHLISEVCEEIHTPPPERG